MVFIFREDIVLWTRKKITGTPVIRINSVAEAEEFLKKYHTFVIGLFDKFEMEPSVWIKYWSFWTTISFH
ncbi:hypothetical protein K1719_044205 [Acacia pycnantha]|nr:hypothetical protein K1719_044205 [Acacia pycnantha]